MSKPSLTREAHREIAEKLIQLLNNEYEFSDIYESDEADYLPYEDQRAILNEMCIAKLTVSWDD